MIVALDAEKTFDNSVLVHVFFFNSKLETKGYFLNQIKGIYENPTVNIIFNGEKLKTFP